MGQTSPLRPRLVVSRSTCPPLSPSPHVNSFVLGTAVINTHTVGDASLTRNSNGRGVCIVKDVLEGPRAVGGKNIGGKYPNTKACKLKFIERQAADDTVPHAQRFPLASVTLSDSVNLSPGPLLGLSSVPHLDEDPAPCVASTSVVLPITDRHLRPSYHKS
jgi:hypothetical protein